MNQNTNTPQDPQVKKDTTINPNVQALHQFLVNKKVKGIPDDVNSFAKGLSNDSNRRNIHGALKRMNVRNVPNSYTDFQHKLGIPTETAPVVEPNDDIPVVNSDLTIKDQSYSRRKQRKLQRQEENKESLDELRQEYETLPNEELKSIIDKGLKDDEKKITSPLSKITVGEDGTVKAGVVEAAKNMAALIGRKDATNRDMRLAVAKSVYDEKTFKEHYEQAPPNLDKSEDIVASYRDYLKKYHPEDPRLEKIRYIENKKNKLDTDTEKEFLDDAVSMISQIEREKVESIYTPEIAEKIQKTDELEKQVEREEKYLKDELRRLNNLDQSRYTASSFNSLVVDFNKRSALFNESLNELNSLVQDEDLTNYISSVEAYSDKMTGFVKGAIADFYKQNPDQAEKTAKQTAFKEIVNSNPFNTISGPDKPIVGSVLRQVDGIISMARYFDGPEKEYSGLDAFSDNFSKTMDFFIDDAFGPEAGSETTFNQIVRFESDGTEYNAYLDRESNIIDIKKINADKKVKNEDGKTERSKESDIDDGLKASLMEKYNNLPERALGRTKLSGPGMAYNTTRTVSDMLMLLFGASKYTKAFGAIPGMGAKTSAVLGLTTSGFVLEHNDLYSHAIDAGMKVSDASRFALKTGLTIAAMENISPQQHVFGSLGKKGLVDTYIKRLAKGTTVKPWAAVTRHIVTEIGEENIQEISQTFAEKMYDYAAFKKFGLEEMLPTLDLEEVMETVMLTTIASGLLAGGTANTIKREPHIMETEALFHLVNMPNSKIKKRLEAMIANNTLSKDNANRAIEIVNEARAVKDKIPSSITNPTLYGQLLTLVTDKSRLENQLKGMDDAILKAEGPAIQEKIDKINAAIEKAATRLNKTEKEVKDKAKESEKITPVETDQKEETAEKKTEETKEKEPVKEEESTDDIKISETTAETAEDVNAGFRSVSVTKDVEGFERRDTEETDFFTELREEGFYENKEKGEVNSAASDLADLAHEYLSEEMAPADYLRKSGVSTKDMTDVQIAERADKLASIFYKRKGEKKPSEKKAEEKTVETVETVDALEDYDQRIEKLKKEKKEKLSEIETVVIDKTGRVMSRGNASIYDVGSVFYNENGEKIEIISVNDKYGRSVTYRINNGEKRTFNPKTSGYGSHLGKTFYTEDPVHILIEYDKEIEKVKKSKPGEEVETEAQKRWSELGEEDELEQERLADDKKRRKEIENTAISDLKSTLSSVTKMNKQPVSTRKKGSIQATTEALTKINEALGQERFSVKRNPNTGTISVIDNNTGKAVRSVPSDLRTETKKPVAENTKQEKKTEKDTQYPKLIESKKYNSKLQNALKSIYENIIQGGYRENIHKAKIEEFWRNFSVEDLYQILTQNLTKHHRTGATSFDVNYFNELSIAHDIWKEKIDNQKEGQQPQTTKEQTISEKHKEALTAAKKGKVEGKVKKNKTGAGFTFTTKGGRTFGVTGTWSKIVDPTLDYEVKVVEMGKEGDTVITSDGTRFTTVKMESGELKLTKDGLKLYDDILELHSVPRKGKKSQFIGNIESGYTEGKMANIKAMQKTIIDQYTDETIPETKPTSGDAAAKALQHLKNAWNISKKPGDLNSTIIGLPNEAIKEILLAAKELIVAGARSVGEIQRKLKDQIFSMDIPVENKTMMFNMIDRHVDEFETLIEEMELIMKFPNNNIAEAPEKLKAIRSSLSTIFKAMEKLGVDNPEAVVYDISKTHPLKAKNEEDYKKWQEDVRKAYEDGVLMFEALDKYNIGFEKVVSIMNFYENVKAYKHGMLTYDGDGGYSVIDMNNKMQVEKLVRSIRNTIRNYTAKDSNGRIIKNRNAALKQDYRAYRLAKDKADNDKQRFDLDIEFLSKMTGIEEKLWRLYFSPKTNETVVYRRQVSAEGKVSYKKEVYESAEDLFAQNNNNFPEDMYYRPNRDSKMKRFSIIGTMGAEFDSILRKNESKFSETAIKFFVEKAGDKAWPNAVKLASLKSTQYEFDFMTPEGKRGVALIQTSNLSIAAEQVREQDLPKNDVVKYYKSVDEDVEIMYISGTKSMASGVKKAAKPGDMSIKDMVITQALLFLESFNDAKGNDVYFQSLGQFGDKRAFALARVKKQEINEKRLASIEKVLGEGVFDSIVKAHYNYIFKGQSKLVRNKELNTYQLQIEFTRKLVYNFMVNKANLDQIFFGTPIGEKSNYKDATEMYKRAGSTNSSGYRLNEYIKGGVGERIGTEPLTKGKAAYRHIVVNENLLETLGVKDFESFDGITLISDKFASRVQKSMGLLFSKSDVFEKLVTLKALHSSVRNNIRGLTKSNMVNAGILASSIRKEDNTAYHKLNQFMIENDIDMLSFESGTKKVEHKIKINGKKEPAIYPIFNRETGEFDASIDPSEYIYERLASDLIVQQDLRNQMILKFSKQPIQFIASTLKLRSSDDVSARWNRIQGMIARKELQKYNEIKHDAAILEIGGKKKKFNLRTLTGLENGYKGTAVVKTFDGKVFLTIKGTNIKVEAAWLKHSIGEVFDFTLQTSLEQKRNWIRTMINYKNDPDLYALVESGANLEAPHLSGAIRLKIASHINNEVLERKIRRVQAQEVPGVDIPLQTHSITKWLNKDTGLDEDQVILGHVLVDMEGLRYSEEYGSFNDAIRELRTAEGLAKYPDMFDSNGNVKEWEIYEENGKWYIPGEPIIITRIPSDDLHSHQILRVKYRMEWAGNLIITDRGSQMISGADNDGDMRYIEVINKDANGNPDMNQNSVNGLLNANIYDVIDDYQDPENFDKLMRPINTNAYNDIHAKHSSDRKAYEAWDPIGYYDSYEKNNVGNRLKGVFTNISVIFSFMSKHDMKLKQPFSIVMNGKKYHFNRVNPDEYNVVKANLGNLLNMAYDNGKDPKLEEMYINEHTANLVAGLLMTNQELADINNAKDQNDFIITFIDDLVSWMKESHVDVYTKTKRENKSVSSTGPNTMETGSVEGDKSLRRLSKIAFAFNDIVTLNNFKKLGEKVPMNAGEMMEAIASFMSVRDNTLTTFDTSSFFKDDGMPIDDLRMSATGISTAMEIAFDNSLEFSEPAMEVMSRVHSFLSRVYESLPPAQKITGKKFVMTTSDFTSVMQILQRVVAMQGFGIRSSLKAVEKKLSDMIEELKKSEGDINEFLDYIQVYEDGPNKGSIGILNSYKYGELSSYEKEVAKRAFAELPSDLKELLSYYSIAKYGIGTGKITGNYFDLIDQETVLDITNTTGKEAEKWIRGDVSEIEINFVAISILRGNSEWAKNLPDGTKPENASPKATVDFNMVPFLKTEVSFEELDQAAELTNKSEFEPKFGHTNFDYLISIYKQEKLSNKDLTWKQFLVDVTDYVNNKLKSNSITQVIDNFVMKLEKFKPSNYLRDPDDNSPLIFGLDPVQSMLEIAITIIQNNARRFSSLVDLIATSRAQAKERAEYKKLTAGEKAIYETLVAQHIADTYATIPNDVNLIDLLTPEEKQSAIKNGENPIQKGIERFFETKLNIYLGKRDLSKLTMQEQAIVTKKGEYGLNNYIYDLMVKSDLSEEERKNVIHRIEAMTLYQKLHYKAYGEMPPNANNEAYSFLRSRKDGKIIPLYDLTNDEINSMIGVPMTIARFATQAKLPDINSYYTIQEYKRYLRAYIKMSKTLLEINTMGEIGDGTNQDSKEKTFKIQKYLEALNAIDAYGAVKILTNYLEEIMLEQRTNELIRRENAKGYAGSRIMTQILGILTNAQNAQSILTADFKMNKFERKLSKYLTHRKDFSHNEPLLQAYARDFYEMYNNNVVEGLEAKEELKEFKRYFEIAEESGDKFWFDDLTEKTAFGKEFISPAEAEAKFGNGSTEHRFIKFIYKINIHGNPVYAMNRMTNPDTRVAVPTRFFSKLDMLKKAKQIYGLKLSNTIYNKLKPSVYDNVVVDTLTGKTLGDYKKTFISNLLFDPSMKHSFFGTTSKKSIQSQVARAMSSLDSKIEKAKRHYNQSKDAVGLPTSKKQSEDLPKSISIKGGVKLPLKAQDPDFWNVLDENIGSLINAKWNYKTLSMARYVSTMYSTANNKASEFLIEDITAKLYNKSVDKDIEGIWKGGNFLMDMAALRWLGFNIRGATANLTAGIAADFIHYPIEMMKGAGRLFSTVHVAATDQDKKAAVFKNMKKLSNILGYLHIATIVEEALGGGMEAYENRLRSTAFKLIEWVETINQGIIIAGSMTQEEWDSIDDNGRPIKGMPEMSENRKNVLKIKAQNVHGAYGIDKAGYNNYLLGRMIGFLRFPWMYRAFVNLWGGENTDFTGQYTTGILRGMIDQGTVLAYNWSSQEKREMISKNAYKGMKFRSFLNKNDNVPSSLIDNLNKRPYIYELMAHSAGEKISNADLPKEMRKAKYKLVRGVGIYTLMLTMLGMLNRDEEEMMRNAMSAVVLTDDEKKKLRKIRRRKEYFERSMQDIVIPMDMDQMYSNIERLIGPLQFANLMGKFVMDLARVTVLSGNEETKQKGIYQRSTKFAPAGEKKVWNDLLNILPVVGSPILWGRSKYREVLNKVSEEQLEGELMTLYMSTIVELAMNQTAETGEFWTPEDMDKKLSEFEGKHAPVIFEISYQKLVQTYERQRKSYGKAIGAAHQQAYENMLLDSVERVITNKVWKDSKKSEKEKYDALFAVKEASNDIRIDINTKRGDAYKEMEEFIDKENKE